MNFIQVEYAVTAAKYRSISIAAEHLFISQSALSQQISKLEKELGYSLFIRESHGLKVTHDGENFFKRANTIVESWLGFCDWIAGEATPKEHLRISMGYSIFTNDLMSRLIAFFESQPDITVSFTKSNDTYFLKDIESGSIDLALERVPCNYMGSDLFIKDLFYERSCVIMGKKHPLASRTALSYEDLRDFPILSGPKHTSLDLRISEIFPGINEKEIAFRSGSIDIIINLLRTGNYITIAPESFGKYYDIVAVPIVPEEVKPLQFICKNSSLKRKKILSFLNFMTELCNDIGF